MSKSVTLKQIAVAVNKTVSTVSMALSNHPHISPVTMGRKAVDLLIRQLSDSEPTNEKIVVPMQLVIHETAQGSFQRTKEFVDRLEDKTTI